MARLTDLGVDGGTAWPAMDTGAWTQVVLVCRASAAGAWAAAGAVDQYRARRVPGVRLLGLVAVAASPRRPPRVVAERLRMVRGWLPALWRVEWVESLLAADDPGDIGPAPSVQTVHHEITRATQIPLTPVPLEAMT